MSKVLITGGAGYVGTHLVRELWDHGHEVRVLDNLLYNQELPPYWFQTDDIEFVEGDVNDDVDVESAITNVDYVIYLASIVGAPACAENPRLSKATNYEATKRLYEATEGNTGFIFASTGSVYGEQDGDCTEDSSVEPESHYAKTKYQAEQLLGDDAIIYRPATAFGLSPRHRVDLLVNDLTHQATENGVLMLWGGDRMRTFIHVVDLARVFLHGIENFDQMRGETYNVGDDRLNYSKSEVCEIICEVTGAKQTVANETPIDPDRRDYWVDYNKIKNTGYEINHTLVDGVRNMHEFYEASDQTFEKKNQKLSCV